MHLINTLSENRQWIFSGIGVTITVAIATILWKLYRWFKPSTDPHKLILDSQSTIKVEVVTKQSTETKPLQEKSEVADISKRMNSVIDLMNENARDDRFTIAGMANIMGLETVGELESMFCGRSEPSFVLIKRFCETFSVNNNWLTEGKGNPFSNENHPDSNPFCCLAEITATNPERVYFMRANTDLGEVFLLYKYSDHCYKIVNKVWHISEHVGSGGRAQILGMYNLIKAIRNIGVSCGGRILNEDIFKTLFSGHIFPGSIIRLPNQESNWWDDFTDISHTYPIASKYESWYGTGFIKAQEIIEQEIGRGN